MGERTRGYGIVPWPRRGRISLGFVNRDLEAQLAASKRILQIAAEIDSLKQREADGEKKSALESIKKELILTANTLMSNVEQTQQEAITVVTSAANPA
jgi:hypothetical protein